MADYYPLIAKAVAGLDKSSGEARRALYERARGALVTQLRSVAPALSESDITRERLALEEAIRKVEAEAARKARFDPPPERRRGEVPDPTKAAAREPPSEPAESADDESNPGAVPSATAADLRRPAHAPERGPLPNDGLKGFRHVVADAENLGDATAQASRSAREAYNAVPSPSPEFDRLEPRLEPEGLRSRDRRSPARDTRGEPLAMRDQPAMRETPRQPSVRPSPPPPEPAARDTGMRERPAARERATPPRPSARDNGASRDPAADFEFAPRGEPLRANEFAPRDFDQARDFDAGSMGPGEPDDDFDAAPARPRPRRRLETAPLEEEPLPPPTRIRGAFLPYLVIGAIILLVAGVVAWQWQPMVGAIRGLVASVKITHPAPQPSAPPTRPKITDRIGSSDQAAPSSQPAAADVAQRVVLYEEDPEDASGKRFVGSAVWRTEDVSPGAGQPPEKVVRADIDIPERKMTMKWTLRRNSDKTLPASHTVEVVFTLPPDFSHGGIQTVPGVLMKEAEQMRGVPLAGSAVKVTDGYFLIGLSAVDTEMQRNIELLKERPWFDVPIVYTDGRRAILAVEKGTPGERAFSEAFAAWKQ